MVSEPNKTEEGFVLCDICYEEYEQDKEEDKPIRHKKDPFYKKLEDL